jgi:hypothetical protein
MSFARWTFRIAGILGLIVMPPHYFLEEMISRDYPPAITHPEYYYGYFGVGIMWQLAFVMIAQDPARYRLLMIPGILEKFAFGSAMVALFLLGRTSSVMLVAGAGDLVLAGLFVVAWRQVGAIPQSTPVAYAPGSHPYNEPHELGDRNSRAHTLVR